MKATPKCTMAQIAQVAVGRSDQQTELNSTTAPAVAAGRAGRPGPRSPVAGVPQYRSQKPTADKPRRTKALEKAVSNQRPSREHITRIHMLCSGTHNHDTYAMQWNT